MARTGRGNWLVRSALATGRFGGGWHRVACSRRCGGLVAFSVRLDIMTVLHNPSGAYFRIDGEDTLVLLHDRRFFHGYDMASIEAGARAAVHRERAPDGQSGIPDNLGQETV